MNIEKLFKKAEKFFILDKGEQEKKQNKREKLKISLLKKISSLKKKVKISENSNEKKELKKQLEVLKKFHEKLK
ncbi:MAG: hypothetical protein ACI9RG_000371 [Sulfurimonas sp.]|jgi:hypothetical protein